MLEQRYLIQNETCAVLREYLISQNFNVTDRKLKAKFNDWGWVKKITRPLYTAMKSVIENTGPADFFIPKRGGTFMDRLEYKKVYKEVNRKKKPLEVIDFSIAREALREAGITWQSINISNRAPRGVKKGTQIPPNQRTRGRRCPQQPVRRSDDDEARDHSDSSVSDESIEDVTNLVAPNLIADNSRLLNHANFAPQSRFPQSIEEFLDTITFNSPRRNVSIPYDSAWLADVHFNFFPHKPEYAIPGGPVKVVNYHESPCVTQDYSDYLGISLREKSTDHGMSGQKRIAEALTRYYRANDKHGHKSAVLQFVAYYAGFLLAGQDIMDDYDHPLRRNARGNLTMMLDRQNMELLPACYWITIIVMSYDKIEILLAFFEDLIDCIETNSSYLATVMQPWIRFMVLIYRDMFQCYKPRSYRLEPEFLDSMKLHFNASSELQNSINRLQNRNCLNTTTCLILRIYRGWNLGQGHEADHDTALIELLSCLQESRAAFGPKHLVTIQCQLLVARLYTEVNKSNLDLAENYLDYALLDLTPCSRMMETVFHRALLERARHVLKQGRLNEARRDMDVVFKFHLRVMGPRSPLTGEAAEELFALMRRQGHGSEAQQREDDLSFQRNHQWKKNPLEI